MATTTTKRIGELLGQMVPISSHDIDEILQEQTATRRPFGEIALSLGLCQPEHVWKAWCGQLLDGAPRRVNIDTFGIDTQAISYIPADIATRFNVIPVRVLGDFLIVAADCDTLRDHAGELSASSNMHLRFVLADTQQIRRAVALHYPKLQAAG